jgi:hypothetical protein
MEAPGDASKAAPVMMSTSPLIFTCFITNKKIELHDQVSCYIHVYMKHSNSLRANKKSSEAAFCSCFHEFFMLDKSSRRLKSAHAEEEEEAKRRPP